MENSDTNQAPQLREDAVSDSVSFAINLNQIRETKINLHKKESELIFNFISKNRIYNDGQKVKVISKTKEEVCFILSCGVHDDGELFYRFMQSKKDGTISKNRYYPSYYSNEFTIVVL